MKQQLWPLLCACALVLASSLSVLGVAGAEGPAVGAKRQQAPVKRVRSAESSIEPVTNAAKELARSLQEQIGAGLTRQKLLGINKPKNKKNALGKGAKFAINDAKADGKSPVGGRVLTSSGDLYVTYLPTAQGVIGVIEASTRLPTNSKADKTLRIELDVVGFRLNKVVEFYQFAFWPQRPSETLAAVVSRPPEFVSKGISPQQAEKLLATRKKNAKSMTDAAIQATEIKDTIGSLAWKCGTGATPPVQNPPGSVDGSTPSTCNSTKEEIKNCQGYVLCACPAPGMSGGGCCCQPVPKPQEVIKLPVVVPGKDVTQITVPIIPGLQLPAVVPGKDVTQITVPEIPGLQPSAAVPGEDGNQIKVPEIADLKRPAVVPGEDQSNSEDNKIALPVPVDSARPTPYETIYVEPKKDKPDEERIAEIVNEFTDDYMKEYGSCPSAAALETLEEFLSEYDSDEVQECFFNSSDDDEPEDDKQPNNQPAPLGNNMCPKSKLLESLLQQVRDKLPTTSDELLKAECEGARKALDAKIERQSALLQGTKARLAFVRKDIADLESSNLAFFIGHRQGTFDLMKRNEAIEIETLATQQNLLSTLKNGQKPVDCSPETLRRVITETDEQRKKQEEEQSGKDQELLADLRENISRVDNAKYTLEVADQLTKTSAFLLGGPLFGSVVALGNNAIQAGGHVSQGNKDLSPALTDASQKAANDLFDGMMLTLGGWAGGKVGSNMPLPSSWRFAWLGRKAIAGGTAGITIGSGQAGKGLVTGTMSGEQAAHTLGASGLIGMASGMLSSNKLSLDLLGQVLVSSLSTVATGDPSSGKFYEELIQNATMSFVANRAAKCGINPKPKTPPNLPADPPMSREDYNKNWRDVMMQGIQKFEPEVQPALRDYIERQPVPKRGEGWAIHDAREIDVMHKLGDSMVKIRVFSDSDGLLGISDAVRLLDKPTKLGKDAYPAPLESSRELISSFPNRQRPDKSTLTSQAMDLFKPSKDSRAERLKKGEQALKDWISLKLDETSKKPTSPSVNQYPTIIKDMRKDLGFKDLEQQSVFIKGNPDGWNLGYIAEKSTGNPLAITHFNEVDPNSPNGVIRPKVNDYADPLASKDPNSAPPILGGRRLSPEALKERESWLDTMRTQINETAPLSAQEALGQWIRDKSLNENTNWERTVKDPIMVQNATKERITNSSGSKYDIIYKEDVLSKHDGNKPGGKVWEILKVELIPKQPRRLKETISEDIYYMRFLDQFQKQDQGLRNWVKNEKNCPADAEEAFLGWARADMIKKADFQAVPSSFPWQKVEKVTLEGPNGTKYEAEIVRDDRTGLIQPRKITEIETTSASK